MTAFVREASNRNWRNWLGLTLLPVLTLFVSTGEAQAGANTMPACNFDLPTGSGATQCGVDADAAADNSIAVGNAVAGVVGGDAGGVAVGNSSITDTGVAVGGNSGNSFLEGVGIGDNAGERTTTGVAVGTGAESISGVAIGRGAGDSTASNALSGVAIGTNAGDSTTTGVSVGTLAEASQNNTAVGFAASAPALEATALGESADASGANSVALGTDSIASAPDVVSVGTPGFERRVVNVTDAVDAQDAVTLSQLQAQVAILQAQIDLLSASVPGLGVPGASVLAGLLVGFVFLDRHLGRLQRKEKLRFS